MDYYKAMMSQLLKIFTFYTFLCYCQQAISQQEPMFTQYMFTKEVYNPASIYANKTLNVGVLHRSQWLGIDGAPETQFLKITSPIQNQKATIGLTVVNDKIGSSAKTIINVPYAYGLPLGKGHLSIAIQPSFSNVRGNWSNLAFRDPSNTDLVYQDLVVNNWLFNVGTGVYYDSKKFYLGFAIPNMIQNKIVNNSENIITAYQNRHMYGIIGTQFAINNSGLVFEPNLLYKSVSLFEKFFKEGEELIYDGSPDQVDLNLSLILNHTFWLGTSFRTQPNDILNFEEPKLTSANLWIAYKLKNGPKFGFAFDYFFTSFEPQQIGSFEVFTGYDFNSRVDKLTTPRYF